MGCHATAKEAAIAYDLGAIQANHPDTILNFPNAGTNIPTPEAPAVDQQILQVQAAALIATSPSSSSSAIIRSFTSINVVPADVRNNPEFLFYDVAQPVEEPHKPLPYSNPSIRVGKQNIAYKNAKLAGNFGSYSMKMEKKK